MRKLHRLVVIGLFAVVSVGCGAPPLKLRVGVARGSRAFAPQTVTVPAGATVELTFENNSAEAHVFVLVDGNEATVRRVAAGALHAGAAGEYIPSGFTGVIAHTALVEPGTTDLMLFSAPVASTYVFLCTYPSHLESGMRGVMIVQ